MPRAKALSIFVVVAALFLVGSQSRGFEKYRSGTNGSCAECHSGFVGGFGNPLHDLHLQMTSTCLLCHTVTGDIPNLGSSGSGVGCVGCHKENGLRLHHTNASVPAGSSGLTCIQCHPGDPTPDSENTLPEYYLLTNVNVSNPCATDPTQGGEDYDMDSKGLDNDGDLAYEQDDQDCVTAIEPSTWGSVKKSYKK